MEKALYGWMQAMADLLEKDADDKEMRRAMLPHVKATQPFLQGLGVENVADMPPFDYALLAGLNPRALMLILLSGAAGMLELLDYDPNTLAAG